MFFFGTRTIAQPLYYIVRSPNRFSSVRALLEGASGQLAGDHFKVFHGTGNLKGPQHGLNQKETKLWK